VQIPLRDIRQDYPALVKTVCAYGQQVTTRGMPVREVLNANVIIRDVRSAELLPVGVGRSVNLHLAAVEALQLIAGRSYPELVLAAAPQFTSVLENPATMEDGAYGPRVDALLSHAVEELRHDPHSRRCFTSIWRPDDLASDGDRPCTIGLQYTVRNEELHAFTYMRSNDVWLGLPYDVWSFTQLQQTIAQVLGYPVGGYYHVVTSLHIYERDLGGVAKLKPPETSHLGLPRGLVIAPVAEHLPENVPLPEYSWAEVRDVARALLEGTASELVRATNLWYATRIDEVRARLRAKHQ
jgi:thymidylate synthase